MGSLVKLAAVVDLEAGFSSFFENRVADHLSSVGKNALSSFENWDKLQTPFSASSASQFLSIISKVEFYLVVSSSLGTF